MTVQTPRPVDAAIETLRDQLRGRVIVPGDDEYDAARTVVMGGIDPRPPVIARVADAADVATVVTTARERGLELAIRGGGHSSAAHCTTDRGIVLDLRDLKALEIDPVAGTAWAETGLTAGEGSAAAAEHGLAIGFGDTGTVGIGGITLGGGVGYLVRKHGLTIDSLLAVEIVTADGQLLRASETEHPDLFWALRGGGGNFGVATRFQFRLHPLEGIVGGMLVLPATADTIAGFIAACEAAPEELSGIGNVMSAPPMPFLAEELHGRVVILAMLAWAGDVAGAESALAPFRALAEPLADFLAPMPYTGLFQAEAGEEGEYHPTAAARTLFVDRIDREVASTILEHLEAIEAPMKVAQLRVLGGAMARVPADATAFAHRSRRIMVNVAAFYEGDADRAAKERWVDAFAEVLAQGDRAGYVNFLMDEGPERVRAAYPGGTYERLAEVKRRYDPTNLFRRNQNIPPAASA